MDTLNIIKTIVEMATGLIGTLFPPIKMLLDARSDTSQKIIQSVTEISAMMDTPDREKIDIERLRTFAELVGKAAPFAWVDYAYFVTKVAFVITLMIYISERRPFGRQR